MYFSEQLVFQFSIKSGHDGFLLKYKNLKKQLTGQSVSYGTNSKMLGTSCLVKAVLLNVCLVKAVLLNSYEPVTYICSDSCFVST